MNLNDMYEKAHGRFVIHNSREPDTILLGEQEAEAFEEHVKDLHMFKPLLYDPFYRIDWNQRVEWHGKEVVRTKDLSRFAVARMEME